ncbi:NAD(P)-dependent alcohol dehydrogenase [Streptomyces sp. NPDC093990]|uniref:NAD(P)-dependent alcohol dehydrogenase n=1 Tax=Streptomyces sp. NPDC093990 TaxID=3155306 RepID=UPI00343A973D
MPQTTAAVVDRRGAQFALRPIEVQEPRRDEILVRVQATGMCHADLAARNGDFPFPLAGVLGHEGAGVVERIGEAVTAVRPGDLVILTFDSCGRCTGCVSGLPSQCAEFVAYNFSRGTRLDGSCTLSSADGDLHGNFFGQSSFAGYALTRERNTIAVPDNAADVPAQELAPLGCGIQTGAGVVLNVLQPRVGSTMAIFGAGVVGLAALMAAALLPLREIVVVDIKDSRLELARKLGATQVVNSGTDDPVQALKGLTGGGPDMVVESSGVPAVLAQAVRSLAPGGTAGVVGVPAFGATAPLDVADIVNASKRIVGVVEGQSNPPEFLPRLATMVADGRLPVRALVKAFPLGDIERAAEEMRSGLAVKPVLVP